MKKFGMMLGAAAIVAIAGCKDPNYKRAGAPAGQDDVKNADTTVAQSETPAAKQCTCAPGTRHAKPCECGGANCACIVEDASAKPVQVEELAKKPAAQPAPAEPETTVYVVQSGDYLAKISKRFNVTIASIKSINNLKGDVIRVGQKLKIPGKVDVGTPAAAAAPAKKSSSSFTPYTGATKEYVVKSGDTLGAVAYGNGINIRQLKELNGLKNDNLRVGQKLKVPAEKPAKAVAAKKSAPAAAKAAESKPAPEAAPAVAPAAEPAVAPAEPVEAQPAPAADVAAPAAEQAAVPAAAPALATYVVQEGDDMTGVSIRWGVSAAEIRELNNLGDADQLKPGQILKLPAEAQQ